jgi:hypothetical protein
MTSQGRYFDLLQPESHNFPVREIAHALSNLCRFTGHTRRFYSVAQHSVLVSYMVPKKHALQALFHDASEAYLGDVSSPLKALIPDYRMIERRVEHAIAECYGFQNPPPACIKRADLQALHIERRMLLPQGPREMLKVWPGATRYRGELPDLPPVPPFGAKYRFLQRYQELTA